MTSKRNRKRLDKIKAFFVKKANIMKDIYGPVSDNKEVNCVFIFAYDNNCLYWIENKLFLFYSIIFIF